jgi:putative ABC transport system permease protein
MDIRETASVAIDALRANKLRAILTSLGVIIGSASIVLVVTVALTSKKFVLSRIESIGSNLVWVELVQRPDKPQPLSYEMTLEDMEAAKSIPNVIQVAGTRELPMAVITGGAERPVSVVGVTDGIKPSGGCSSFAGGISTRRTWRCAARSASSPRSFPTVFLGRTILSEDPFAWGS